MREVTYLRHRGYNYPPEKHWTPAKPVNSAKPANTRESRLSIRKHTYRGEDGYLLYGSAGGVFGTRIFTHTRQEAERIREQIKRGEEPFPPPKKTSGEHKKTNEQRIRDAKDKMVTLHRDWANDPESREKLQRFDRAQKRYNYLITH